MSCPTPCACPACLERELARPAMHPDLDGLLLQLAARPTTPDDHVVIERELARLAAKETP